MKEYNTKLLMKIASYMATNGVVDISYNEIKEIVDEIEDKYHNSTNYDNSPQKAQEGDCTRKNEVVGLKHPSEDTRKGCGNSVITPDMSSSCGDINFNNEIIYCLECQNQNKSEPKKIFNDKNLDGLFNEPTLDDEIRAEIDKDYPECRKAQSEEEDGN